MKVKKLLGLLLAAVMVFTMIAACAPVDDPADVAVDPTPEPTPEATPEEPPELPPEQEIVEGEWLRFEQPTAPQVPGRPDTPSGMLTVGENVINADFMEGWTNAVGNARTRDLINGYGTVVESSVGAGMFLLNPMVVAGFLVEIHDDGSQTYTIQLHENLLWSDGTPITAADYIFSSLYSSSPIVVNSTEEGGLAQSALIAGMNIYTGAPAFIAGETDVHAGFRLIDEFTFSATVDFETDGDPNFPNWWAVDYYNFGPLPMHVIAPNASIVDTGDGVTIDGDWSIEVLRSTVDDGSAGYRYAPTVSAGAYRFISFDEADGLVTLEVNPYFLGDYAGFKPMIERIFLRQVVTAVAVEEFTTGGVDLFVNASSGAVINPLLEFAAENDDVRFFNFPRNGYGFVDVKHHIGPTQFAEVRRALIYTLDREEAGRIWTGGHGVVVHSEIGLAQWMYTENQARVDAAITQYAVNVDRAIEELESGGWTLDADGNEFVRGESALPRHKDVDGELMPLHVYWFAANEQVGDMLYSLWTDNMTEVGMTYTYYHSSDFELFTAAVYADEFPDGTVYNIVSRGADFAPMPHQWFNINPDLIPLWNTNHVNDPHLLMLAERMRDTEPGDFDAYFEAWLDFVVYVNYIVLDIWLYSDMRHTFHRDNLHNFAHTATYPYSFALVRAWVT